MQAVLVSQEVEEQSALITGLRKALATHCFSCYINHARILYKMHYMRSSPL
jgi:hypothetical protein